MGNGSVFGVFSFSVRWDGATNDVPSYPGAHKVTIQGSGPYLGSPGVTVQVNATIYLMPGIGPVQGSVLRDANNAAGLVRRTTYAFTLKSIQ